MVSTIKSQFNGHIINDARKNLKDNQIEVILTTNELTHNGYAHDISSMTWSDKGKIPMQSDHSRDVRDNHGSIINIKKTKNNIKGIMDFNLDLPDASDYYQLNYKLLSSYKRGDLTDVSIGTITKTNPTIQKRGKDEILVLHDEFIYETSMVLKGANDSAKTRIDEINEIYDSLRTSDKTEVKDTSDLTKIFNYFDSHKKEYKDFRDFFSWVTSTLGIDMRNKELSDQFDLAKDEILGIYKAYNTTSLGGSEPEAIQDMSERTSEVVDKVDIIQFLNKHLP